MCSCSLSLPADLSSTGSTALLLLLHSHFLRAVRLLLNINGKFGADAATTTTSARHLWSSIFILSISVCIQPGFFSNPESGDIRVSFLVYVEWLPTERMRSIVNIEAWRGGQK